MNCADSLGSTLFASQGEGLKSGIQVLTQKVGAMAHAYNPSSSEADTAGSQETCQLAERASSRFNERSCLKI